METRYINYCTRHKVLPNPAVLSSLAQADHQKSRQKRTSLLVVLDHLKEADYSPLIDVINAMNCTDHDAVSILNESPCVINEEQVLSLIYAANRKLHTLNLHDFPFTKHFLRDLFRSGLSCRSLKLSSSNIQKLNMDGSFLNLKKLNLDFCTSLTTIQKDCFSQMPNLMHLSMCETRVANLWTTTAALSKLPSLVELRFQNCLCCEDTGPCPAFSSKETGFHVSKTDYLSAEPNQSVIENKLVGGIDVCDKELRNLSLLDLSDDSAYLNRGLSNVVKGNIQKSMAQECGDIHLNSLREDVTVAFQGKKYISHHPSPICFEKNYREFMIASLPQLEVLDNLPLGKKDREVAEVIYSKYFECLPYNRRGEESIPRLLHSREIGSGSSSFRKVTKQRRSGVQRKTQCSFSRSVCAAKLGASPWPLLQPISSINSFKNEESKIFRPRQFEYHPTNSSLMAFGTLDGEVVVINHENRKLVSYIPNFGASSSILGLCWLKHYPNKVLGGSDNGLLRLYDIADSSTKGSDNCQSSRNFITFDTFEQLTSVHSNSTDELCLVSGCTRDVAMYDMNTGKRAELFTNLHREPINVAKFANHSPFMFVTSSFDHDVKMWDLRQSMAQPCYSATSSRGNVMAYFSPDDRYLLVSAVDNEVKQLLAVDGRLHLDFGIASSGSSHNYTRSYYMNGRDYIISGSSDEHVVRVCCAETGRRLRDVYFEGKPSEKSMFVQSLRSDPFREFNMSILASYGQSNSKCEIIKVNLLASSEDVEDDTYSQQSSSSFNLGG